MIDAVKQHKAKINHDYSKRIQYKIILLTGVATPILVHALALLRPFEKFFGISPTTGSWLPDLDIETQTLMAIPGLEYSASLFFEVILLYSLAVPAIILSICVFRAWWHFSRSRQHLWPNSDTYLDSMPWWKAVIFQSINVVAIAYTYLHFPKIELDLDEAGRLEPIHPYMVFLLYPFLLLLIGIFTYWALFVNCYFMRPNNKDPT